MDELRTATVADADACAQVLADAFFDDPIFTWLFPDAASRPRLCQAMFAMLGEHIYLPRGASVRTGEVAALWEPPGTSLGDDFWVAHGDAFVEALEGHVERLGVLGAAMDEHHPDEPCWYLALLGVRPSSQGRGLGGRALQHTLDQADAAGQPAYLEASSPRNRVLYERHGFEVVAEFSADGAPPMWAMWREPRPPRP